MATRKVKATKKQKRAVNNILSGRFKTHAEAMREAGYSKTTSHRPAEKLLNSKGVETYIKSLGVVAQKKWGLSLESKTMQVYLDGLDATKLYGKDGDVEYPDFATRLKYADRFISFFGWDKETAPIGNEFQQNTFFSQTPEDKIAFNEKFRKFLVSYYSSKDSGKA